MTAEFDGFTRAAKVPRVRPISRFACEEIILPPGGPFQNLKFNLDRQPWARLWFELIEAGQFCRFAVVGPTQNGKTLTCYVIIALYYLFEMGENVGVGIPQMEMSWDKWTRDFLPVIRASRYADLLPETGQGSKGGQFSSITFRNGATLKFVSAKGDDSKRSGITFRVLVMTEVDKFDRPSAGSREEDPITQMIARLDAFATLDTLVFMECTASIEEGRIWVEYITGSAGRIALQCPHCAGWVTPEREHLIGWQDAENELEARHKAYFACPDCGDAWTEAERELANLNAKLVHKGQEITPEGDIAGELPPTLTAGFRWNAANNLLRPAADFGGREWVARNSASDETSKSILQFMWAKPSKSEIQDQLPLKLAALLERTHPFARGVVPPDCDEISVAMDLGGWWCHWTAIAWGSRATGKIIDHGRIAVPQASLGLEAGLMEAMREFRERCGHGWTRTDNEQIIPNENLLDSGWQTTTVYQFISETGLPYRACKGFPVGGQAVSYHRPKSTGAIVKWIGDGWHIARLNDDYHIDLLEVDADHAKTILHARLTSNIDAPGAITMFEIDRTDQEAAEERRQFVRHLTAEKSIEEFIPGRGTVTKWVKIRASNHWLDSTATALIGGSVSGVNAIHGAQEPKEKGSGTEEKGTGTVSEGGKRASPLASEPAPPRPPKAVPVPERRRPDDDENGFAVRQPKTRTSGGGWVRRMTGGR